ncbi:MAG: signal recognition particle receptor subunit alpha [Thermoproteota archaeon]
MVLDELGKSLRDAFAKLLGRTAADEAAIKEFVKEIQRALLRADVSVSLVLDLSQRIEKAASQEIPPGVSRKDQVIYSAYNELIRILGKAPVEPRIERGRANTYMLVGTQGSGKTTTAAKIAFFYQKKGLRPGVICSDTYRPGALQQLVQLLQPYNIPVYGEPDCKDPVKIALNGTARLRDECDLIIIDTAGRHKDEKSLLEEMEELSKEIKPDRILLTVDATMGQQAGAQAKAFHEAVGLGYIVVSKMDGAARGPDSVHRRWGKDKRARAFRPYRFRVEAARVRRSEGAGRPAFPSGDRAIEGEGEGAGIREVHPRRHAGTA